MASGKPIDPPHRDVRNKLGLSVCLEKAAAGAAAAAARVHMKAEPLHLKDEMKGKHLDANAAKGQSLLTYQWPAEAGGRPAGACPCA